MSRRIHWEYWRSPFGDDEDEFVPEEDADEPSPWAEDEEGGGKPFKIRPVVPTPMGFLPVHPFQSFAKAFRFWMGHTNFDITAAVRDRIEVVPGVEILDIITRYCFRVAVGKAFRSVEVKREIERVLDAQPPPRGELNPKGMKLDAELAQKVAVLKQMLPEKFAYWAIFVLPNGEIDFRGTATRDEYETQLEVYRRAQEVAGGVIYQHA